MVVRAFRRAAPAPRPAEGAGSTPDAGRGRGIAASRGSRHGMRSAGQPSRAVPRRAPLLYSTPVAEGTAADRSVSALLAASAVATVLAPLGIVTLLGAGNACLWLDEITYFRLQDDIPLRAAEIGRPGAPAARWFSNFFYCDVQRLFQIPLVSLGLANPLRSPEALVRTLSLVAYAATLLVFLLAPRRRSGGLPVAVLGTLVFGGMPLILFYAFEGRVYAAVSLVVVALMVALEQAAASGGGWRLALVASLAILAGHLHLWTICLFAAFFLAGAADLLRRRQATPRSRALFAASLPGLVVILGEFAAMKATQPSDPPFALFRRQPLQETLFQTVRSVFEGPLQVQHVFREGRAPFLVAVGVLLLAVLVFKTATAAESTDAFGPRSMARTALLALGVSVALAVGFGHFVHGRYQVPLHAALLYATARGLAGRPSVLLAFLLVSTEVALLPSTASAIQEKSNNATIAKLILTRSDRSATAVVVQHGVVSGYPVPHHSIGLGFYLNDLSPGAPAIPILELPGLRPTNGDPGTYRYFNGGEALLARTLAVPRDRFREWATSEAPARVWIVFPRWPVPASERQVAVLREVLIKEAGFAVGSQYLVAGYPEVAVEQLVKGSVRPPPRVPPS